MGFYILYLFWYVKRCSIFSLSVSHKNYWMCADDLDEKKNAKLKVILEDYFHDQTDFKAVVENTEEEVSTNTNYMSSVVFITIILSKNIVSFLQSANELLFSRRLRRYQQCQFCFCLGLSLREMDIICSG